MERRAVRATSSQNERFADRLSRIGVEREEMQGVAVKGSRFLSEASTIRVDEWQLGK